MTIQNANDALRAIVNSLDDLPPILKETLKTKRRQEIEESFFSSYFDENPGYRVEVPTPTISNNAEYAKALARDKAIRQQILEQTRARIQEEAAEAANRRFVELGYSKDLLNARDLAKDLYHEEILNSSLPYVSNRWQPTIYQDEIPEPKANPAQKPGNVEFRKVADDGLPTVGRSAKVPQSVMQIEGDIFIPQEEEQALRDQFRNVQNGFFNELKKKGLIQVLTSEGNRVVPKQYATFDKTLGEKGRYTLKPEVQTYLESKKANAQQQQSPLEQTPQLSPPASNAMTEAELSALEQSPLNSQPQSTPQEVLRTAASIPTNSGAIAPGVASVLSTQPGMPVQVYDFDLPDESLAQVINSKESPGNNYTQVLDLDGHIGWLPNNNAPQYEGKSSVEAAPASGVNNAVYPGSKAVGTSSDLPGGGNYDFEGKEFNRQNNYTFPGSTPNHPEIPGLNDPTDPDANLKWLWERNQREAQAREQYLNNKAREEANTGNYWQNLWDGTKRGFQYSVDAGRQKGRTASVGWNRAPEDQYAHLQDEGKFGFGVGRTIGDVIGNGSRQVLWNLHPADFVGTHTPQWLGEDATRMAQVVVPFAAVTGLELGSQTYNPFNLGQGGRVAGYAAINPDDEDPRISTTPVSELLIDRGLLGKRGRLLPWEQFRQERTDIPYEQYEKYQNYLRNKDENFLRDATGGLVKGTLDGINGPELSVMGYSVTPTGALAAGAALLAGRELVRTGRIAGFRKQ